MIRVRMADVADTDALIEFIHDEWSASHIFARRPELFSWQHVQVDGRLNMVLAEDVEADAGRSTVLGVLGFIPMGRFSASLGDTDLALAIWKVRDGSAPPGLGLRLLKFLQSEIAPDMIAAIGTSKMVRRIYEVLRYEVGSLHQTALFNPDRRRDLRIASGVPDTAYATGDRSSDDDLVLIPLTETADPDLVAAIDRCALAARPAKNWDYLVHRYQRHPWYRYELRAVQHGADVVAVVVWRRVEVNESSILRIVDVVGDTGWLQTSGPVLREELRACDAEYIDIMQWGIAADVLTAGGFVGTDTHPELVLPNYFAPFEARNVEVEIAFKVFDEGGPPLHLYRADSDQDRPNQISELDSI